MLKQPWCMYTRSYQCTLAAIFSFTSNFEDEHTRREMIYVWIRNLNLYCYLSMITWMVRVFIKSLNFYGLFNDMEINLNKFNLFLCQKKATVQTRTFFFITKWKWFLWIWFGTFCWNDWTNKMPFFFCFIEFLLTFYELCI